MHDRFRSARRALSLGLIVAILSALPLPAQRSTSALNEEPGTMDVEDLLEQPVTLKVGQEATIFYQATMDRVLGTMAPGTVVTLVAMADHAYRVRGRARHGDVAGWVRIQDLVSPDPNLHDNLKKMYERQKIVRELIEANEVALGMSTLEVEASLGKPSRSSSKISASGKEDVMEYAVYDRVPQAVTGRDRFGRLVQSIVYVKVETGTLSITFRDDAAVEIEEKKGNPLGGNGVKIVVPPITFF